MTKELEIKSGELSSLEIAIAVVDKFTTSETTISKECKELLRKLKEYVK